ncbi:MAG: YqaE/Pmp3 family membrane protein [Phycisphaerales bacterium]|nr:YqaE/Pmp3 family membrane protein [Phycisphaerales bacterium]
MADIQDNKLIMILLAIFVPPVAVGLKVGFTAHFWINLLLWFVTWIGGIIHGLIVVLK